MNKKDIIAFIKRRIKYHRKNFNRYHKETLDISKMRYISKRNKKQFDYSYEHKCRELDVVDELELVILKRLENKK